MRGAPSGRSEKSTKNQYLLYVRHPIDRNRSACLLKSGCKSGHFRHFHTLSAKMTPVRSSFALLLLFSACFVAIDAFVAPPLAPAVAGISTSCPLSSSYLDTLDHTEPSSSSSADLKIRTGDKLPVVTLHWGFNPPTFVDLPLYCNTKNVLIVGVRGAFMQESNDIVATYLQNTEALKSLGVEEVIITTVNDGGVTGVWNQKIETQGSLLTFLADPHAELMDALGTKTFDIQWEQRGLLGRSQPFVMYVEGCIVKHFEIGNADAASATKAVESLRVNEGQVVQ